MRALIAAALALPLMISPAQAEGTHHHSHEGSPESVVYDDRIAELYPMAMFGSMLLQDSIGRRVPHQGTQSTGGHTHFDLTVDGVTYDMCTHPERGEHTVMHIAPKTYEWRRAIEGSPGYYEYSSYTPRMILEVGPDGSVGPYHGNFIAWFDNFIAVGYSNKKVAVAVLGVLAEVAEKRLSQPDLTPTRIDRATSFGPLPDDIARVFERIDEINAKAKGG